MTLILWASLKKYLLDRPFFLKTIISGDAFSTEMLAWFNSQQKHTGQSNNNVINNKNGNSSTMNTANSSNSNKPATLV